MKLTQAQYDDMPKELQKLFKQDGDEWDNGEENATALKTARDRERDAAKKLRDKVKEIETERDELQTKIDEADSGAASKIKDSESLKKSYDAKIAKMKADHEKDMGDVTAKLRRVHVDAVADKLASDISVVPDLMSPEIMKRLDVDLDGDTPTTRVLDAEGNPSAATLEELKEEILSNPKFERILIGSKGSGGGAGGGGGGGGAFDIKTYKNEDGTVNWTKVHQGMADDPQLLTKVKEVTKTTSMGQSGE